MPAPPPKPVAKKAPPPKPRTRPVIDTPVAPVHPNGVDFRIEPELIPHAPVLTCPRCGGTLHDDRGDGFYGPCATCRAGLRRGDPAPPGNHLTPQPPTVIHPNRHMIRETHRTPNGPRVKTLCGKEGPPYVYKDDGIVSTIWRTEVTCKECAAMPGVGTLGAVIDTTPEAVIKAMENAGKGKGRPKKPPKPKAAPRRKK